MSGYQRRRDQPASTMTIREAFAMHVLAGLEATQPPNELRDPHFARYIEWRVDTLLDRLHTLEAEE